MKMNRENIADEVVEFILTLPDKQVGLLTVSNIVNEFPGPRNPLNRKVQNDIMNSQPFRQRPNGRCSVWVPDLRFCEGNIREWE